MTGEPIGFKLLSTWLVGKKRRDNVGANCGLPIGQAWGGGEPAETPAKISIIGSLARVGVVWTGFVGAKHGHVVCCCGGAPSSSPILSSPPLSPFRGIHPFPSSFGPLFPLEWCLVSLFLLLFVYIIHLWI